MTVIEKIRPTDLKEAAASYSYEPAAFLAFEQAIWNRMRSYGGAFGHTMIQHLNRTSSDFGRFLKALDYDGQVALNLASAFRLHDAGKVLQSPTIWGLEDKPDDNIREIRRQHPALGAEVLEQTLEGFPKLRGHPHLSVIECLMINHHERITGAGPQGLSGDDLGEVLEAAGIVDTVDGKALTRAGQNDPFPRVGEDIREERKAEALRDMTGLPLYTQRTKHAGEFRLPLLLKAIEMYQSDMSAWILPRPRFDHQSLASPRIS